MEKSTLEQRFINSFIDAFRKYILNKIQTSGINSIEYEWYDIRKRFRQEFLRRSQNHISRIIGLTAPGELYLVRYWQRSKFPYAIDLMLERVKNEILTNSEVPLKQRLNTQMKLFKSVVRTESQHISNSSREWVYRDRDPLNRYRYVWGIRRDHRTSQQCLEIAARVDEEKRMNREKGVRLDRLKSIVREVAMKYAPDYPYREWVPHYNCRSKLRRIIL